MLADALMRQVLIDLETCSERRAQSYDAIQVHGGTPDYRPKGFRLDVDEPQSVEEVARIIGRVPWRKRRARRVADLYAEAYNRARNNRERLLLVKAAQAELKAIRRTPTPTSPKLSSPQWKRFVAESELPAAEIARQYGVSRQYVARVRAAYGG